MKTWIEKSGGQQYAEILRYVALVFPPTDSIDQYTWLALCDTSQDLAEVLMATLMSILEDPTTRRYVRPHLELHQLLTGFTDLDGPPGPERAHRWKVSLR